MSKEMSVIYWISGVNLVDNKLHLLFTSLLMFAEAVLGMNMHMNSPVIGVPGRPDWRRLRTAARWLLLMLPVVMEKPVIIQYTAEVRYVRHPGCSIPQELRRQKEKPDICHIFTVKFQADYAFSLTEFGEVIC